MLVISNPHADNSSLRSAREIFASDKSISRGERITTFVEFNEEKTGDDSVFTKRDKIIFIKAGVAMYKSIPSLQQPKYDGWTLYSKFGDLVFEGTDVTLTKLVNAFLYERKADTSMHGEQKPGSYIKPYGPGYPNVTIILFVKNITSEISECIRAAVGIDVFGRVHRKLCIIAIPVDYHSVFNGENHVQVIEQYLEYLASLLKLDVRVRDILSAFPGSRLFAQREQYDADGDDLDLRDSLKKAINLPVTTIADDDSRTRDAVGDTIEEIKSRISNRPVDMASGLALNDEVNCTVYAPAQVARGGEFLVQVFSHTYVQQFELTEVARAADDISLKRGMVEPDSRILQGSRISIQLSISGLIIEEDILSNTWNGKIQCAPFTVKVPEETKPSRLIAKILVSQNAVPIGQIKFSIEIIVLKNELEKKVCTSPDYYRDNPSSLERFKKAFISYASADRSEVLKRVQMLNLVKLDFFQDLLTLEPGDEWEKKIYDYIDNCDVFFIFWSKSASESEWVKKETLWAYKLKKESKAARPEIIPVIIEGPPPAEPPEELKFLHFNDKFIYFINKELKDSSQL